MQTATTPQTSEQPPIAPVFTTKARELYAAFLGYNDVHDLMDLQARARAGSENALIPRTQEQISQGMRENTHLGIYHGQTLIAHIRIGPDCDDAADPTSEAALCAVMIDPAWRGHKLAHTLIEMGVEQAKAEGYQKLNARVHPDNPAMWTTFEKHNFQYEKIARSHERPAEPDCQVYHYKRHLSGQANPDF
jgi:RimJ/RimL family protein N-acetyltransferase